MNSNFKQTDIGLIPVDWELDIIGNHFDIKQGKQLSKRTRVGDNQRKFLRTANVFWGKLDLTELDEMHFTKEEEEKLKLRYNDLLVCEGGDIGRTAIWRNDLEDCFYQNHIHRVRLKKETIHPLFFMNWMYYGVVLANKYFGVGNRTTIPNLSASRLKSYLFPLPPLSEQKKIAHILSRIQQAIETQEQIIKTTQELKKALMHKLFTEGLNGEPQKQSALGGEIGPIPESWEIKKIIDFAELVTKGSSPRWQGFQYQEDGVKFVRSQNIGDGYIIYEGIAFLPVEFNRIQRRSILQESDLLINLVGASIGRVAVAPASFNGANTNQAVGLVRFNQKEIDSKFIMYFLLTKNGQWQIRQQKKDIARANISLTDINNFSFPYTNLEEQLKISKALDNIENQIDFNHRKMFVLKDLFSTILNNLMTGQVRVKDIEFELEESLEGTNA